MPVTSHPNAIAVVDDDDAVRRAVSFALESEGYVVLNFADAEALLASTELGRFACFVIDLKLPDQDGLAVIRVLRQGGVTAPAILVTTQPDARCRHQAEDLGAPIVEKPLMGEALSDEIRRMVGSAISS